MHPLELSVDHPGHRSDLRLRLRRVPVSRDRIIRIEAIDGVGQLAHEIPAPQLAVRENLESELFLFSERLQNILVFHRSQARWVGPVCAGRQQIGRAKKATHMVGSKLDWHCGVHFLAAGTGAGAYVSGETATSIMTEAGVPGLRKFWQLFPL